MYDPSYWDRTAQAEPQAGPDLYTQAQCVTAFKRGLKYLPNGHVRLLKTDLWTEGVATQREVLQTVVRYGWTVGYHIEAHGIDISRVTCARAGGVQADIRALPFRQCFDMILDVSTIDHVKLGDALGVISEYYRCLKPHGVLVLIFAHRGGTLPGGEGYFIFPVRCIKGWTQIRFTILEEYAIHMMNTRPVAYLRPLAGFFQWLEFTPLSKHLKGIAPLYVMIARKA